MGDTSASDNFAFDFTAARSLPANLRFGTSSWTYPGWQGIVYHEHYRNETELKRNCLAEYGQFPWFRTVGLDHSFYAPPKSETLRRYAYQLPESFLWVAKVWEEITIPQYARHARYGAKAGKRNPDFLNADKFETYVLGPCADPSIAAKCGPFVLEFQMLSKDFTREPGVFFEKLEQFLAALPQQFRYAVEIRNKELLLPEYFALLNKHQATHCFNHWSFMPPLREQMNKAAASGGLSADFYVARILTPLGLNYTKAVETFRPYNSLKQPLSEMRADVVRLAKRAVKRQVAAFILVNNRSEGCAPATIDAIGQMTVAALNKVEDNDL